MSWKNRSCFLIFLAAAFILGSGTGQALDMQALQQDLKPLNGYVVDTVGGKVIIDLGRSDPIAPGDLFTVAGQGKKIVHPVTKEVLGHVQNVQAMLRVHKVEAKFSYTRPLFAEQKLSPGQKITRFGDMQAVFWDYTDDDSEALYQNLREALPHLNWITFSQSQADKPSEPELLAESPRDRLYFIHTQDGLDVRGPSFQLLHQYAARDKAQSGTSGQEVYATQPGPDQPGGPVAYKERFSQLRTIAAPDEPTVMADFLSSGQEILMASSNGKQIRVSSIGTEQKQLASAKCGYPGKILALSWWAPQETNTSFIAATIWYQEKVQSALFSYADGSLNCIEDRIGRLIFGFDLDGDHEPETLLAQEYDKNEIFGTRTWKGSLQNGSLSWQDPDMPLPRQFQAVGSAFADVTGNGEPELVNIRENVLFIFDQDRAVYKSSMPVGGSASTLTYEKDTSSQNPMTDSVRFELAPQFVDLDNDQVLEVIVPTFSQDLFGSITGQGGANQSRLLVLNYKNGRFEHGTLGGPLEGSIQGLHVTQDTVYVVTTQKAGIFKSGGQSNILSFPLKQ
ncbi:hypothetical protein [Desulfovermiculus halophilus]|uniref:hypothetical protein n=1 Tax=Desulfovermiculus halophilus TaxID=339722 RepID=UPI0004835034|nr:hypothetical protein [Desulfovermiculus halophilus]